MTPSSLDPKAKAEANEKILLVDDNPTNLQVLYQTLDGQGYNLLVAKNGEAAIEIAKKARPSLILLDIMMPPGIDGFETIRRLKKDEATKGAAVIFLSALGETKDKVQGFELGAVDYISKPFQGEEVMARVTTHLTIHRLKLELELSNRQLNHELKVAQDLIQEAHERLRGALLGESGAVRKLRQSIEHHVETDETVLLIGAPGAGEEAVARAIHHQSKRKNRPFIHVNCPTIKADQHASLFGTLDSDPLSAKATEPGKFDLANGGTLYLDGINGLDISLQKHLLQVLLKVEEHCAEGKPFSPDVHVIAFTSGDLAENVRKGLFNPDLYRLLSKRRLTIPELVERQDDIPVLVDHFIQDSARRLGKIIDGVSKESMEQLKVFRWKGNIRELQNLIEHFVVETESPIIEIDPGFLNNDRIELEDIKVDARKISREVDEILRDFNLPTKQ